MFKGKLAADLYIKGKLIETDDELEFNKLMKELTDIEESKKKKDEPPPPKKEEPPPPKKKINKAALLDLDDIEEEETPKNEGESSGGNLYIKVNSANLFRDTEAMGDMDPFFKITYKGKDYKTKTLNNAGKRAEWHESFEIEIDSQDDDITFAVYDEDPMTNDLVGERTFKVKAICQSSLASHIIPLIYEGKKSAEVNVDTRFTVGANRKPLEGLAFKMGHIFEKLAEAKDEEESEEEEE